MSITKYVMWTIQIYTVCSWKMRFNRSTLSKSSDVDVVEVSIRIQLKSIWCLKFEVHITFRRKRYFMYIHSWMSRTNFPITDLVLLDAQIYCWEMPRSTKWIFLKTLTFGPGILYHLLPSTYEPFLAFCFESLFFFMYDWYAFHVRFTVTVQILFMVFSITIHQVCIAL